MRRLLLLGCSKRKKLDPGLLPAIDRYDGPVYKILQAYRAKRHRLPVIFILSARYGLISGNHPIENYDAQLVSRNIKEDAKALASRHYRETLNKAWWKADDRFLIAGGIYREVFKALMPFHDIRVPPHLAEYTDPVYTEAKGRIGEQLHQFTTWLNL